MHFSSFFSVIAQETQSPWFLHISDLQYLQYTSFFITWFIHYPFHNPIFPLPFFAIYLTTKNGSVHCRYTVCTYIFPLFAYQNGFDLIRIICYKTRSCWPQTIFKLAQKTPLADLQPCFKTSPIWHTNHRYPGNPALADNSSNNQRQKLYSLLTFEKKI